MNSTLVGGGFLQYNCRTLISKGEASSHSVIPSTKRFIYHPLLYGSDFHHRFKTIKCKSRIIIDNNDVLCWRVQQVWCEKPGIKNQSKLYKNDVHSPSNVRVLGTLRNSKEFSDVFKCPTGSRMNPNNKCSIW